MKRVLNKKFLTAITCWILIIGMVLTASPAFSREKNSSHDRDRTYDSDRSRDRDGSRDRNDQDRDRYKDRYHKRTTSRPAKVVHVHRGSALPAIIATGIVAGITFSLLDRNDPPAPQVVTPAVCPTAAGPVVPSGAVLVTAALLNIRSGPGLNKPCVGQIHRGARLSIMATSSGWYYVSTPGGVNGWVMAQYTIPAGAGISG